MLSLACTRHRFSSSRAIFRTSIRGWISWMVLSAVRSAANSKSPLFARRMISRLWPRSVSKAFRISASGSVSIIGNHRIHVSRLGLDNGLKCFDSATMHKGLGFFAGALASLVMLGGAQAKMVRYEINGQRYSYNTNNREQVEE